MSKLNLDKYYTPTEVAKRLIDKTYSIIGENNISEVIEPSAGNGSFSLQIPTTTWAYDVEPEHESIVKQDFLKLNVDYLYGRLIIGNPPFGEKMNLAQKFFKKSVLLGDYIAFILPISQLNNTNSLFEFNLIYSEDLGLLNYSDVSLHCCFNIYKRPDCGELNKRKSNKLNDITITRQDSKKYEETPFDIRMCYWGNGSGGKIITDVDEKHSAEYKIKINNPNLYQEIYDCIVNYPWKENMKQVAMRKIQQFHITDLLKDNIKGIK